MKKAVLILFLFLAPTLLQAQIEIGELKVASMENLFNPENKAIWDEIGAFTVINQTYFIPNFPYLIFRI